MYTPDGRYLCTVQRYSGVQCRLDISGEREIEGESCVSGLSSFEGSNVEVLGIGGHWTREEAREGGRGGGRTRAGIKT
jgi:hypothetical protein